MDGMILLFCGIEFQTVGAANWKALRQILVSDDNVDMFRYLLSLQLRADILYGK